MISTYLIIAKESEFLCFLLLRLGGLGGNLGSNILSAAARNTTEIRNRHRIFIMDSEGIFILCGVKFLLLLTR